MGDATKKCPACAETIQAEAVLCRFCKFDLRTGQAAGAPPPLPVKSGGSTVLIIVAVVGLGILLCGGGFVAALVLPAVARANAMAKQQGARHLIDNLTQAAKNYELDHDAYPPGTGAGSAELARTLQGAGPRKIPYYEFMPGMLTERGDIRNPIWPDGEILRYRNNAVNWPGNSGDPTVHNKTSFDIWCRGANRMENSCNNWD